MLHKFSEFKVGTAGSTTCPESYQLVGNKRKCERVAKEFFAKKVHAAGCWQFGAVGCVYKADGVFFNTCKSSIGTSRRHSPVCEAVPGILHHGLLRLFLYLLRPNSRLSQWDISSQYIPILHRCLQL